MHVNFTLGTVPSWVNSGMQSLDTPTQYAYYTSFVNALWQHVAASSYASKISQSSTWNEPDISGAGILNDWTGTMATMVQMSIDNYSAAHGNLPNITVLSPSFVAPGPKADAYYAGCQAASSPCFDFPDFHCYVSASGHGATYSDDVGFAPELITNFLSNERAILVSHGYGNLPVYQDECWVGPATGGFNMDTDYFAARQMKMGLLLASGGVAQWDHYDFQHCIFGSITSIPACIPGNETTQGYVSGLNRSGLALRTMQAWLSGATFTTPIARIAGTNQLSAFNGSGVATGLVAGSGGCSGAPAGTGQMPPSMSAYLAHPSSGLSIYVVGFGASDPTTSSPYLDVRLCGADTTAGSGSTSAQITYGSNIPASVNQEWISGIDAGIVAGSLSNITALFIQLEEDDSGGSYLSQLSYNYFWPTSTSYASVASQRSEFRSLLASSSTAKLRPNMTFQMPFNGSAPLPVDITMRFSQNTLDQGFQWAGEFIGHDGATRCIVWDASGGLAPSYTPAGSCSGFGYYRDMYNAEHRISGGVIPLNGSMPVLIEAAPAPMWVRP